MNIPAEAMPGNKLPLPTQLTEVYPTRYAAFDNPGILMEQKDAERMANVGDLQGGGYEFAVYHEPMQNARYPHLTDGIYAEIVSYQGRYYQIHGNTTSPDACRTQFNELKQSRNYAEAKQFLVEYVAQAKAWLGRRA